MVRKDVWSCGIDLLCRHVKVPFKRAGPPRTGPEFQLFR